MEYLEFSKVNSGLFIKRSIFGVGETAQWLGALAARGLSSSPSLRGCSQLPETPVPGCSDVLFWPLQATGKHVVPRYACRQNTQKTKIKIKKHKLLVQNTGVRFPAPTLRLTAVLYGHRTQVASASTLSVFICFKKLSRWVTGNEHRRTQTLAPAVDRAVNLTSGCCKLGAWSRRTAELRYSMRFRAVASKTLSAFPMSSRLGSKSLCSIRPGPESAARCCSSSRSGYTTFVSCFCGSLSTSAKAGQVL